MPQMNYDIITLGHGSGGLLTNRLLDQMIFDLFSNPILDERHDGAVIQANGPIAFSTDSFVVSPIFFPGGNIGDLAVNGTVNDVAMCGAIPQYISLSFIIEEGLKMTEFWEILLSIKHTCDAAGVQVVTGDTKVVDKGKGDKIFINTTGIGAMHPKANIHIQNVQSGDKIIVSGHVASHGMAIMSVREGLSFETEIESDTAYLNHTIKTLLDEFGTDIHLLRDPTRGGVSTVLTEIAKVRSLGVEIIENNIPILKQVNAACELLGLDPLYVANEGLFVAIVSNDQAESFLHRLRQLEFGEHAAMIGEVVSDHPGQVLLKSAIGGRRVLNMLVGDQLPRIC
ncbi:MAG: hydrogenase expression/formation protein HypE [Bacteroidia bacterium]|nr:hydrogenase expression/formation protein HypE [Bacteroidia bacterium]